MSQITDFAAKESAVLSAISAKVDGVKAGVKTLEDLITKLQGTVTGLTPEEQKALDDVAAASDTLLVNVQSIDVNAPAAPAVDPAAEPTL